ncbi:MAG: hypothetical protein JST58_10650 [Bacteroidetes bacterium]|nr:hypothetical protein [Bacteroidota bacterium]
MGFGLSSSIRLICSFHHAVALLPFITAPFLGGFFFIWQMASLRQNTNPTLRSQAICGARTQKPYTTPHCIALFIHSFASSLRFAAFLAHSFISKRNLANASKSGKVVSVQAWQAIAAPGQGGNQTT